MQVPEEQKFFAARAKVPTHLKRDSDGRVFYFTVGLLSVGGLMFAKGDFTFIMEVLIIVTHSLPFSRP